MKIEKKKKRKGKGLSEMGEKGEKKSRGKAVDGEDKGEKGTWRGRLGQRKRRNEEVNEGVQ